MATQPGERRPARGRSGTAAGALVVALLAAAPGCGGDDRSPPTDPSAGTWRTWVVPRGSVEVPPPPAPGSAQEQRERDRLRAAARSRSPAQERGARRLAEDAVVAPWLDRALELQARRLAQKDPPAAARAYALLSVAMYDATVESWRAKYRYKRSAPDGVDELKGAGPEPSYPSEHAAVAGAASRVLAYAFPEEPALRLDQLADDQARLRVTAGYNWPSDVDAGLDVGRRTAAKVIERAKADGFGSRWDGKRPAGPEHWEPPPGSVAAPVRPAAARWRTWVLGKPSRLRPAPPPAYGSPRFLAEAREVLAIGRRLTPDQKRIAHLWAAGEGTALPPGLWNQVALAQVRQSDLSAPRAARTFALLNTAMADAAVAAWDAKYAYWSPRPENAVRDLRLDRDWKPLLKTPAFPAYPSGHSTFSAAAATVLAHLFPERREQFHAKAREAGLSRLYGGIHYRADNDAGLRLGDGIGELTVRRARRDGAEQ